MNGLEWTKDYPRDFPRGDWRITLESGETYTGIIRDTSVDYWTLRYSTLTSEGGIVNLQITARPQSFYQVETPGLDTAAPHHL